MPHQLKRRVLIEKINKGSILSTFGVYMEICCDYCNEVIHNHIDCPSCGLLYAPTSSYFDLSDEKELKCVECGTGYRIVSGTWYGGDFEVEVI